MPTALDIYRTASVLVREHGDDATIEAARRAILRGRPGDTNINYLKEHDLLVPKVRGWTKGSPRRRSNAGQ